MCMQVSYKLYKKKYEESILKVVEESGSADPDPNLHQNVTDPQLPKKKLVPNFDIGLTIWE